MIRCFPKFTFSGNITSVKCVILTPTLLHMYVPYACIYMYDYEKYIPLNSFFILYLLICACQLHLKRLFANILWSQYVFSLFLPTKNVNFFQTVIQLTGQLYIGGFRSKPHMSTFVNFILLMANRSMLNVLFMSK